MEPVFENEFEVTQEMYRELYGGMMNAIKKCDLIISLLFLLEVVIFTIRLCLGQPVGLPWFYLSVVIFLTWVFFRVLMKFKMNSLISKRYAQQLEASGGRAVKMKTGLSVRGAEQWNSATNGRVTLPWAQIKRAVQSERFYFLISDNGWVFSFSKFGFTRGSGEGLRAYVSQMGLEWRGRGAKKKA